MILNRYILSILSLIILSSCMKEPEEFSCDCGHVSGFWLCNRECNFISVESDTGVISEDDAGSMEMNVTEAPVSDYLIRCDVNCAEEIINIFSNGKFLKRYRIPGDPVIEDQIERHLKLEGYSIYKNDDLDEDELSLQSKRIYPVPYEYRTDECLSISITSSHTLFGLEPGANLADHFELFCRRALITNEKQFLGPVGKLSINEYLAYHPLILPYYLFHFTGTPPEVPVETDFYVDIGLADGRHLNGATHIRLLKDQ